MLYKDRQFVCRQRVGPPYILSFLNEPVCLGKSLDFCSLILARLRTGREREREGEKKDLYVDSHEPHSRARERAKESKRAHKRIHCKELRVFGS